MISIIPTRLGKECNTNNHHEYFPVRITDKIEVDKDWYESLLPITQENLNIIFKNYGSYELTTLEYPYTNELTERQRTVWYNIYHCYLHQFDYIMYADFYKKDYVSIPINKSDLIILRDISKVRISRNPSLSWLNSQFKDLSNQFKENIKEGLKKYGNECFVKTEKSSAKNEVKLEPKYTLSDILYHLTSCREYYKEYDFILNGYEFEYQQNVIIMKWREDFNRNREFRMIILDGKIKVYLSNYGIKRLTMLMKN